MSKVMHTKKVSTEKKRFPSEDSGNLNHNEKG